MKATWPATGPGQRTMNHIGMLRAAIQANENHAATLNAHLDLLNEVYVRARGDDARRKHIRNEMAYYTRALAEVHYARDVLRRTLQQALAAGDE